MGNFASANLADLAYQLALGPRHLRARQLHGIENLLAMSAPNKEFPYDLVYLHITGTNPRHPDQKPTISTEELMADLPLMAEEITRRAAMPLADVDNDCLTQEQLSEEFGVSRKTLRRWRSRGLVGIRAVCDDGVNRLVFPTNGVARFKKQNDELVERGRSFKLLTDAEKRHIVERSRELLFEKRRKLHVLSKMVSEETGRAVETVRYTIRQYDAANPDQALFARDGDPVVSGKDRAVWNCHKNGESAEQIARALGQDVASVESTVLELRARQLKETVIDYIDNELFAAPDAEALVLDVARPGPDENAKKVRAPKDVPSYLRALYDIALLTREQEADLFRRFNYLRYLAARFVEELDVYAATEASFERVKNLLDRAESIKNEIIQANLRLVVSIAKRHVGWSNSLFEVISDGNMTLMRAVEKFDFSLGNKFSTYGSWAIMKNFARTVPENHYHLRRYVTGQDEMLDAQSATVDEAPATSDVETVRGALNEGMSHLNDRERIIVSNHFGLFDASGSPSTLEELGNRFGVTKERIRQIEKRAIDKLRKVLSPTLLEAYAV